VPISLEIGIAPPEFSTEFRISSEARLTGYEGKMAELEELKLSRGIRQVGYVFVQSSHATMPL
jgi:hypothetical protein